MSKDKMREEFEAHYAQEFAEVRGFKPSAEEMVSMREGDGYGADRGYLNGYWKGWQAVRAASSLCPGHGRAECVSCCWPAAEQSAGYTAVDMGTAAADGYRDGKANFHVELPTFDGYKDYIVEELQAAFKSAIIAAGGKVK